MLLVLEVLNVWEGVQHWDSNEDLEFSCAVPMAHQNVM